MANREMGEVAVDIGGTSYTLCIDTKAMVALEDHFSQRESREVLFHEVLAKVLKNNMRYVLAFIWAAFQKHHPDRTIDDVNDLIQVYGGIFKFSAFLGQLAGATSPDAEDLTALGIDTANPRKAQTRKRVGTGKGFTSRPAASA